MSISRRDLLKVTGVGAAALAMSGCATDFSKPAVSAATAGSNDKLLMPAPKGKRVVILGGGFGGLTVAKYLRKESHEIEVVVLEKRDNFMSCPYSNVWLGGVEGATLDVLSRDYFAPATKYGYHIIQTTITGVDRATRTVMTTCGKIGYDYLVVAPGIEYDYSKLSGGDKVKEARLRMECPPALMPGSEHLALKRQLEEFEEGNIIITVPEGAYRCPPAPYERAAMMAYHIKKNGLKGKVLILDPKDKPGAKPKEFMESYQSLYPDIIEFHGNVFIKDVDLDKKIVKAVKKVGDNEQPVEFKYEIANIIPKNRANSLTKMVGVKTNADGYIAVKLPLHKSVDDPRVWACGDAIAAINFAAGSAYPKSGHMANAQGKILARQLAAEITGKAIDNMILPNNTCFSMVNGSPKEAIVVNHTVSLVVEKDASGKEVQKIKVGAKTGSRSKDLGVSTDEWLKGILNDIFG
ncbi:MAG: FAD-dependent oxidoreductase [Campylobacterales bacterium]